MRATAALLAAVDEALFRKAVDSMRSGAYQILIASHSDTEVRGSVQRSGDREYHCTITASGASCSCLDARYRRRICKHAVLLALYAASTPRSFSPRAERTAADGPPRPPDLTV